jgi:hypothetical protein
VHREREARVARREAPQHLRGNRDAQRVVPHARAFVRPLGQHAELARLAEEAFHLVGVCRSFGVTDETLERTPGEPIDLVANRGSFAGGVLS